MADLLLAEDSLVVVPEADITFYTYNVMSEFTDSSVSSTEFKILSDVVSFTTVTQDLLYPLDSQTGIEDADYDNKMYVRKNGTWLELNKTTFPDTPDSYLYGQVASLNSFKNIATGNSLSPEQRYINIHDLLAMGMIERTGAGYTYLQPGVDIVSTGPGIMEVPPTPLYFKAVASYDHIQLFWQPATDLYVNHGHAEVYRSETNSVITAVNIGNVFLSYMTSDSNVLYGHSYYYWLRFVSDTGVTGPWHAVNGLQATTSIEPDNLLDVLEGQIGEGQLEAAIRDPIKLITDPGGILDTQSDLRQDLINESNARLDSIEAESNARAAALILEAEARGTAISEAVTILETSDMNLAQQINFISSTSNASFDAGLLWQFDETNEGWTGTAVSGNLRPGFSSDTSSTSPAFTLDGNKHTEIRVRIKKVGNPIWEGSIYYKTDFEPSFEVSRALRIDEPVFFGQYTTASWDMKNVGDWDLSIVIGLKIQLAVVTDSSNYYEIDWVGVGRSGPGASTAVIEEERLAWTTALEAEALIRQTLAVQMRGEYEGTDLSLITSGLIHEEKRTRVEADNALATQFTRIQSGLRLESPEGELADAIGGWKSLAAFTEEVYTRVDADEAASDRSSIIESRLDDNDASITSIQNTIVTNEEALAQELVTIQASLASNTAMITAESVARATADTATASTVTALSSTVVNNNNTLISAISTEASTRASADYSISSNISYVQSVVNDHSISIQVNQNTIASLSGTLNATYTIKLGIDSNGKYYSAGMGISLGNTPAGMQSEVLFLADKFSILPSSGGTTPVAPFRVQGGIVYLQTTMIENASIAFAKISDTLQSTNYVANSAGWGIFKNGYAEFENIKARGDIQASSLQAGTAMVDTLNVNSGAITSMYRAIGGDGTCASDSTTGDAVSLTIGSMPSGATGVTILMLWGAAGNSGDANTIGMLYKNGSYFGEFDYSARDGWANAYMGSFFDSSATGSPTYSIRFKNQGVGGGSVGRNSFDYTAPTLMIIGGKR